MNPILEAKYLRLEKSRNRLLDGLEQLDHTLLNTALAEGKWSIAQIVAHLVLVEEYTVSYIQRKVQEPEKLPEASISHSLKSVLLKIVLKTPIKYKAPALVAAVPKQASLPTLRSQWDDIRYKFEDVLTELPPALLDKCIFKHPYAGPLSAAQSLTFLQDHFDHHEVQIKQLQQTLS